MQKILVAGALALLWLGVVARLAQAGPADWSGQGPFGGGILALQADPLLGSRIYAYTANGFFRSDDGGSSWQVAETGLTEPHPGNGFFLADGITSGGLWLFDDLGRLFHSSAGGTNFLATGYTAPAVPTRGSNALAQGGSNTLWYAAGSSGLLKSTDGGASFSAVGGVLAGQVVAYVATNPLNPQQVVVGLHSSATCGTSNCSIFYSANAGSSWSAATFDSASLPVSGSARKKYLLGVGFGPGGSHRIYALYGADSVYIYGSFDGQLIRSDNDGAAWTGYSQTGSSLTASPTAAGTVWVDGNVSSNAGSSFSALPASGRSSNGVYLPMVSALAAHASYPSRLIAGTSNAGIFLSNDGGSSWSPSNDGLAATAIRSVLVHPQDHTRLFAGYGDATVDPSQAFYRSTSTGNWSVSNSGLNAYQLRAIAFDPTSTSVIGSTVIYAVGSGSDWVGGAAASSNTGLYKSSNGGLNWSTIGNGLPPDGSGGHFAGLVHAILVDPRSCASPPPSGPCATGPLLTLYATGTGTTTTASGGDGPHQWRVMKSIDGGLNWASIENGLPADVSNPDGSGAYVDGVTPIVIDPGNSNILYIGTYGGAFDAAGNVAPTTLPSGVFKSTNAGASWVQASNGLPTQAGSPNFVYDTLSLVIDPNHPQTLWVSTVNANFNEPGQIYKTTNGGTSWAPSNAGVSGPDVRALLIDPTDSTVLYAASAGLGPANPGGVYKSTDSGATWSSISSGLPSNNSTALALDPVDPTVLYAGTSGGVYSITQLPDDDQDGVPDLIENAAPNGGDANHDGTPDAEQGNVSSTAPGLLGASGWQAGIAGISDGSRAKAAGRALQQLQAKPDANGTQGGYFSVQLVPGGGDCTHAVDVSAVLAGPLGVDSDAHHGTYTYPRGLLRFELPTCSTATAAISFNGATFGPGWSWRYYGPSTPGDNTTLGWHNASSLVQSQVGNAWTIGLAAGQFGSYRPSGVGAILFEGGPAYTDTVFRDKFE